MITNDMGAAPSGPIAALIAPEAAKAATVSAGKPFSLDAGGALPDPDIMPDAAPVEDTTLRNGMSTFVAEQMQSPEGPVSPVVARPPTALGIDLPVAVSRENPLPAPTAPAPLVRPSAIPERAGPQTSQTPVPTETGGTPAPAAKDAPTSLNLAASGARSSPVPTAAQNGLAARQATLPTQTPDTPETPPDSPGRGVRDTVPAVQSNTPASPRRARPDDPPGLVVSTEAKARNTPPAQVPDTPVTPQISRTAEMPTTPVERSPTVANAPDAPAEQPRMPPARPDTAPVTAGGKPDVIGRDRAAAVQVAVADGLAPGLAITRTRGGVPNPPSLPPVTPTPPPPAPTPSDPARAPSAPVTTDDTPRAQPDRPNAPILPQSPPAATPTVPQMAVQPIPGRPAQPTDRATSASDARSDRTDRRAASPAPTDPPRPAPAPTTPPDVTAPATAQKSDLPGDLTLPPRLVDDSGILRAEQVRQSPEVPARGAEIARSVQSQLIDAARAGPGGSVEIKLAPEELGRVRMTVSQVDAEVMITVLVERGETLDLMRRHADVLTAELRQAGFERLTFSFGQGGNPGTPDERPAAAAPPDPPEDEARAPAITADAPRPMPGPGGQTRLDIRL